jgi:hypothetical protein
MHRIRIASDDDCRADYWLHDARANADLQAMGEALVEGARVLLVRPGAFERPARLHFQQEVNCWIAVPERP